MLISCHMQSGVVIHALGPEPVVLNASPGNHHVRFIISLFLGLDFRDPPAVTRLTVYWLHIHLWNKWMVSSIFSGLDYHNLYVKITVRWNGNTLPHARRYCHTCTCAHLTLCHSLTLRTRCRIADLLGSGVSFPRSPSSNFVDSFTAGCTYRRRG